MANDAEGADEVPEAVAPALGAEELEHVGHPAFCDGFGGFVVATTFADVDLHPLGGDIAPRLEKFIEGVALPDAIFPN